MEGETGAWLEHDMRRQARVLSHVLERRGERVDEIVRGCLNRGVEQWLVTGCGDSLFAGMCAEYWFAAAAGTPLRAIHALEFSRYLYRGVNARTAVFAISYSGNTARVVEAATAARSRDAALIAVTANGESRLVQMADWWLPNDADDDRSNCGTGNFQAAALLLRCAATRLAELTGGSRGLRSAGGLPQAVGALVESSNESVRGIVESLADNLSFTVIGGGYAYPMALYGAAKLYEAATIPAHVSELEQFVHCEIFPVTERSCILIIAPAGAGYSRAIEIADGLKLLNATIIGISDEPSFGNHCTHFIALPADWGEDFTPFLAAVPLQHFALRWGLRLGDNPDLVNNKWVNRPLIEQSLTWTAEEYRSR